MKENGLNLLKKEYTPSMVSPGTGSFSVFITISVFELPITIILLIKNLLNVQITFSIVVLSAVACCMVHSGLLKYTNVINKHSLRKSGCIIR
jgi:hypothetical protein